MRRAFWLQEFWFWLDCIFNTQNTLSYSLFVYALYVKDLNLFSYLIWFTFFYFFFSIHSWNVEWLQLNFIFDEFFSPHAFKVHYFVVIGEGLSGWYHPQEFNSHMVTTIPVKGCKFEPAIDT